jgi:cytochrome c biogenesis protein CcmG/thiol:disulfide interchange protein DsbE
MNLNVGTKSRGSNVSSPLGVVALVLLLVLGFAALPRLLSRRAAPLDDATSPPAGDFTLPVIANEKGLPAPLPAGSVTLSQLRGRPVILDFWASWCGPCQLESPIVNRVYEKYRDRGLVVIGVNQDDRPDLGRSWALDHSLSFPIAFDDHSAASRLFAVSAMPTLVLVSKTGKKLVDHTGMMDEQELEFLVKQAL